MRSNLLAALLATTSLVLSACAGEEPPPQPPPPPAKPALSELIHDTMKTMHEAFDAHDAAKMASVVADTFVDYDYGSGEIHSRAEFQDGMKQLFGAFGDIKYATNRIWKKGNVVIAELTWTGTMTGDMMGMKATQKPAGQMRLHVYWFNDDGLVKEMHEYADDAGLFAQLQGKKGAPPVPTLPTNPPEMHIAGGNPEQDKLADWAKKTDDGFNSDDYKVAAAEMADDADYWLAVEGGPAVKGKAALTKDLQGFFKAFPDQKWTQTNAWGIDGFGIVEHTMTGTFKGPLGPLHPTGKKVTGWHNIDIMQPTADGKIQHGWGYQNMMEMMAQAGALPKKPAAPHPPPPKK